MERKETAVNVRLTTSSERWLPVVGWPDFEVSDMGQLRRQGVPRLLLLCQDRHGYQTVWLRSGKAKKLLKVHRLVAAAFLEAGSSGDVVDHIDADRSKGLGAGSSMC